MMRTARASRRAPGARPARNGNATRKLRRWRAAMSRLRAWRSRLSGAHCWSARPRLIGGRVSVNGEGLMQLGKLMAAVLLPIGASSCGILGPLRLAPPGPLPPASEAQQINIPAECELDPVAPASVSAPAFEAVASEAPIDVEQRLAYFAARARNAERAALTALDQRDAAVDALEKNSPRQAFCAAHWRSERERLEQDRARAGERGAS